MVFLQFVVVFMSFFVKSFVVPGVFDRVIAVSLKLRKKLKPQKSGACGDNFLSFVFILTQFGKFSSRPGLTEHSVQADSIHVGITRINNS